MGYGTFSENFGSEWNNRCDWVKKVLSPTKERARTFPASSQDKEVQIERFDLFDNVRTLRLDLRDPLD